MPYKKTHPGLDEAMSDEALDRFMAGAPSELVEPPPRSPWPLVATVATVVFTVGLVMGILLAGIITVLDILAVAGVAAGAVTVLCRLDVASRRDR